MMRTVGLALTAVSAALIIGACNDSPAIEPNPPDLIGLVAAVDSPETVDGGRFLGALKLTLADGTLLEVPRGVDYDGPRCRFVAEKADYGAVREGSECLVHVGMSEGVVEWILGFRIDASGAVTPGFSTGDLVEVNLAERFVVTRWGQTFPWRNEPPVVDCSAFGLGGIEDPGLVDHELFTYRFDADGYLAGLMCNYEQ